MSSTVTNDFLLDALRQQHRWCSRSSPHPTDEPQKVTLGLPATDAIATLGAEPTGLPVLQVGGHSSLSNG